MAAVPSQKSGSDGAPPTTGETGWNRLVLSLAGPIILANISTPLLGAVDTAVMGHLPDAAFIGGVAIGALIFDFLFWGFGFLQLSTSGFTAQAFGAGKQDEVRATFYRAIALALVLGLVMVLLQVPIGRELAGGHDPVDLPVDHDGRLFGDVCCDANVLLDQQNGNAGLLAQMAEHVLNLRDNNRRQPFRRFIHHQNSRI